MFNLCRTYFKIEFDGRDLSVLLTLIRYGSYHIFIFELILLSSK